MTKRLAFMLAVALGACAGSGSGRVQYAASVTVRSPELVTIEPDVYVLADADEPIFYVDNYYWLYRGNHWYRSHSYDRDFVSVSAPAPRLRHIRQPTAYVRYRVRSSQEARNMPAPTPPRDPFNDQRERQDFPTNQQEPQEPVHPYPRPPQQESPAHDHRIDATPPRSPTSPAPRDQARDDIRVPDDGVYQKAPPPAQVKQPDERPTRPGQVMQPDESRTPPGQIKKDERRDDKADKAQRHDDDKAEKRQEHDDKSKRKDEKAKPDKKRDY